MSENSSNFIADSFKYLQKIIRQSGPAASASYTLIGAVILLGAFGYFADKWFHTAPILLIVGLLLGIVVGLYELAKTVFKKPDV
jgi:F0F1-type ATP synthase assembly protein I